MGRRQTQVEPAKNPGWTEFLNWQKNLVDYYGYDKLTRSQAGAGDEFSAANAFERGKLAMNMDGEFRTAFIKAEHPELNYGTAPMPVADAHPELYGAGYVTGNIIGIPKSAPNKDAGWELIKYLATDPHAAALLSNGLRNVPTTNSSLHSQRADARPAVQGLPEHLRQPEARRRRRSPRPAAPTRSCSRPTCEVAGRRDDRPAGGAEKADKQIDAQLAQSAGRRCRRAVAAAPTAQDGTAPRPARRRAIAAAARRRAAWRRRRLVLFLMSPWIVGFTVFFGYPLVASAYLSFTHYDLLSRPRWIGLANYRFMFHDDPQLWPAVRNSLWLMVFVVPLQVLFAFGVAPMVTRARQRRGLLPHGLLPADARAAGGGDARLHLPAQPGDRPGRHAARQGRHHRPAVVRVAARGQAVARRCSACGASATR